jgi:peptidoglycan L-alanyl-D-glutamate endopeptidase CwlK
MPEFSSRSKKRLEECHQDIQILMNYAIQFIDFSVICGHRGEEEQNKAFDDGFSKLRFPNSKHNKMPSLAIDIIPYPFESWDDIDSFKELGTTIKTMAWLLKKYGAIEHDIEWGGDWTWKDYPHYQLA